MGKMTDKEKIFVNEYCSNGFNATKAAITAGYAENSARQTAYRIMTNDYIQDAIQEFMAKAQEDALCTVEMVVKGLLAETKDDVEGSTQSARVSAWKALTDYTGGFDNNVQTTKNTVTVSKADDAEW